MDLIGLIMLFVRHSRGHGGPYRVNNAIRTRSILESCDTAVIYRHTRLLVERFNDILPMC